MDRRDQAYAICKGFLSIPISSGYSDQLWSQKVHLDEGDPLNKSGHVLSLVMQRTKSGLGVLKSVLSTFFSSENNGQLLIKFNT